MTAETIVEIPFSGGEDEQTYQHLCQRNGSNAVQRADYLGKPAWLISSFPLAKKVLADPRFSRLSATHTKTPAHTRFRRLIGSYLKPSVTRVLNAAIGKEAERLLASFAPRGNYDLVSDYALRLAAFALHELIAVPEGDRNLVAEHALALAPFSVRRETAPQFGDSKSWLLDYFAALAASQQLFHASVKVSSASEKELAEVATKLFVAGYEPTANLIASTALWASKGDLFPMIAAASDGKWLVELMRYDSPVHPGVFRLATCAATVGDQLINAGDTVIIAIAIAGHDQERFQQADRVDLLRSDSEHLAFGYGLHQCPGEAIATATAQIGVQLLARHDLFRKDGHILGTPIWSTRGTRALLSLPVSFHQ